MLAFLCSAISADELTAIHENLPEELKREVDKAFRKRLEFEFHSAGYHVMLETTTGLRTAAGHLVKVCREYHIAIQHTAVYQSLRKGWVTDYYMT